jgi:hypothetical protein
VLAGAAFAALELRSDHPLLPVRLFADRAFAAGAISVAPMAVPLLPLCVLAPYLARTAFAHGVQQATLALAVVTAVGAVAALAAPGPARKKSQPSN